jgi:hypothetical protein
MPVILATQSRDQDWGFEASLGKWFVRSYLKKPFTKKDWWNASRCSP